MRSDDLSTEVRERLLARVAAAPPVRADVIERAREVLAAGVWDRSAEVASELVDAMVGNRLP